MSYHKGDYKQSNAFRLSMKATSRLYKEGQELTLRGTITNARFYNQENGFVIATLKPTSVTDKATGKPLAKASDIESIVCKGVIPQYVDGRTYVVDATVIEDKTYGTQLSMKSASYAKPSTNDEVAAFIKSLGVPRIGVATSKKIVNAIGKDAYNVLKNTPERLLDLHVKGVKSGQLNQLYDEVVKNVAMLENIGFFASFGLSGNAISRIVTEYGVGAKDVITSNPYVLTKLDGFAFTRADGYAMRLGIARDDPRRIEAGIVATLRWMCDNHGHTVVPQESLLPVVYEKLGLDEDVTTKLVLTALDKLIRRGDLKSTRFGIQSNRLYRQERTIIRSIGKMLTGGNELVDEDKLNNAITKAQGRIGFELTEEQLSATRSVFGKNALTLLTSKAGGGKTSSIKMVTQVAEALGIPYVLCSPTGKAAKRLSEACTPDGESPLQAYTIHRALGIGQKKDDKTKMDSEESISVYDFSVDDGKTLTPAQEEFNKAKIVLCDEVSMLDTGIASVFFKKCVGKHVLLIGDPNQLPSVGTGSVLADMLDCPDIPSVRLTKVFRQAAGSPVIMAANAVLDGRDPCTIPGVEFHECLDEEVLDTIDEFVVQKIKEEGLGYQDIAFMSPMKRRSAYSGVNALNAHLRPIMNEYFQDAGDKNFLLQPNDFVTQTKNNYQVNKFNGDQGVVVPTNAKGVVEVQFFDTGDHATYKQDEVKDNLQLAYASTIHRYQGSECDTVVMVLTDTHYIMCNRNLLYTGITRASKRIILIGNETAFKRAARNKKVMYRYTGLKGMRFVDGKYQGRLAIGV